MIAGGLSLINTSVVVCVSFKLHVNFCTNSLHLFKTRWCHRERNTVEARLKWLDFSPWVFSGVQQHPRFDLLSGNVCRESWKHPLGSLCVGVVPTERSQDTGGGSITCCSAYHWLAGWRVRSAPWRTKCCSSPTMTNDHPPLTCCLTLLLSITASLHGKEENWEKNGGKTVRGFVKVIHSYLRKWLSDAAFVIRVSIDKIFTPFSAGLSGWEHAQKTLYL